MGSLYKLYVKRETNENDSEAIVMPEQGTNGE